MFELKIERWAPVVGFPHYEVSDMGRVRSCVLGRARLLKCNPMNAGYPRVTLTRADGLHYRLVHQLVLEAFVGTRPEGYDAAHINGNRVDSRLSNLCWETRKENMNDKRRHGTHPARERHPGARLSEDDVTTIRYRSSRGESYTQIANDYPVTYDNIRAVVKRRSWK